VFAQGRQVNGEQRGGPRRERIALRPPQVRVLGTEPWCS
jgi:hypothetical protein